MVSHCRSNIIRRNHINGVRFTFLSNYVAAKSVAGLNFQSRCIISSVIFIHVYHENIKILENIFFIGQSPTFNFFSP